MTTPVKDYTGLFLIIANKKKYSVDKQKLVTWSGYFKSRINIEEEYAQCEVNSFDVTTDAVSMVNFETMIKSWHGGIVPVYYNLAGYFEYRAMMAYFGVKIHAPTFSGTGIKYFPKEEMIRVSLFYYGTKLVNTTKEKCVDSNSTLCRGYFDAKIISNINKTIGINLVTSIEFICKNSLNDLI